MIRIAITGPESSGKSTLAEALAAALEGTYVPEFARTYLEEIEGKYDREDIEFMAIGHQDAIRTVEAPLVIVDTDFVMFKVWSEYKYGETSARIHKNLSDNLFDLHVLCAPDIPWEPDPLREHPEARHELFHHYVETLERYKKEYIIVQGTKDARLKKSLDAVHLLQRNL